MASPWGRWAAGCRPALTFRWLRTTGQGDSEQVGAAATAGQRLGRRVEGGGGSECERCVCLGSCVPPAAHPAANPAERLCRRWRWEGGGRAPPAAPRPPPAHGLPAAPFPPPPLFPPARCRRRRVCRRPHGARRTWGARAPSPRLPAAATTQVALLAARPAAAARLRTYRSSPWWIPFASPSGGGSGRGGGSTPRTGGVPRSVFPHPLRDIIVMALGAVGRILPRVHPHCSAQCQSRYGAPRARPRATAPHPLALVREHTALKRLSVIGPCGLGCRCHPP